MTNPNCWTITIPRLMTLIMQLRAAQRAALQSAYAGAGQLSRIALALLQDLPPSSERGGQELKLLIIWDRS